MSATTEPRRYSHAFSFCAEVDTGERYFGDVPVEQLCAALRERLNRIEKQGDRSAFECFDSEDITDSYIPN